MNWFWLVTNLNSIVYSFTGSKEVLRIWQIRKSTFEMLSLNMTVDIFTQLSNFSVPHILCCVNNRVCPGCALYKLSISSSQVCARYTESKWCSPTHFLTSLQYCSFSPVWYIHLYMRFTPTSRWKVRDMVVFCWWQHCCRHCINFLQFCLLL